MLIKTAGGKHQLQREIYSCFAVRKEFLLLKLHPF